MLNGLKRLIAISVLSLIAILVVACGADPATTQYGDSTKEAATPTQAQATQAPQADPYVETAEVEAKGQKKTVLTTKEGLTLYYFTPDKPTESTCTGECLSNWPVYLYNDGEKVPATAEVTGTLDVAQTVHGKQVRYNNHLLYTFAGDTKKGDANGEGIGGKWYVATTDLK